MPLERGFLLSHETYAKTICPITAHPDSKAEPSQLLRDSEMTEFKHLVWVLFSGLRHSLHLVCLVPCPRIPPRRMWQTRRHSWTPTEHADVGVHVTPMATSLQDLCVLGFSDATEGSRPHDYYQGGCVVGLALRQALDGKESPFILLHWCSKRPHGIT